MLSLVAAIAVTPVFIEPLFNASTPLRDEPVRGPILRFARANGIPATEVFAVDASKQTTRVSANVAGLPMLGLLLSVSLALTTPGTSTPTRGPACSGDLYNLPFARAGGCP